MIDLRPHQSALVARGRYFPRWPEPDAGEALRILDSLPQPRALVSHPVLARLLTEWYVWERNGVLEPTRGAVRQIYDHLKAGVRRVLLAAVTGDGKTEIAVRVAHDCASKGWRCYFIVDQTNLIEQTVARFARYNIPTSAVWAEAAANNLPVDPSCAIQVCGLQTIQALIRQGKPCPPSDDHGKPRTLYIFDEAHDQTAWSEFGQRLLRNPGESTYLGLTGSPFRMNAEQGMGDLFDALAWTRCYRDAVTVSVPELVAAYHAHGHHIPGIGSILPVTYLVGKTKGSVMSTKGISRGADGDYSARDIERMGTHKAVMSAQHTEWRRHQFQATLGYCATVEHATRCAEHWSKEGTPSGIVAGDASVTGIWTDGTFQRCTRQQLITQLAAHSLHIVFSVGTMIKGVDIPEVDSGLCLRPTDSPSAYIQMVGRIRRPCPRTGKLKCTWLDMTRNSHTFAPWLEQMVEFKLTKGSPAKERRQKKPETGIDCPSCNAIIAKHSETCIHCGHDFRPPAEVLVIKNARIRLEQIDAMSAKPTSPEERRFRADLHDAYHGNAYRRPAMRERSNPSIAIARYMAANNGETPPTSWWLHAIFRLPEAQDRQAYAQHLRQWAEKRPAEKRFALSDDRYVEMFLKREFGG